MEHSLEHKTSSQRKNKRSDRTYTKKSRASFVSSGGVRSSLNDVSSNPLGEEFDGNESTLRRSRSLAISRADIFTNLNIPKQQRRSQLIPRAKLVDKTTFKERSDSRFALTSSISCQVLSSRRYQQHIEDPRKNRKRQALPETNIIPIPVSPSSTKSSHKSLLKPQDILHPYAQKTHSELDSLDSNYHNKSSFQSAYHVSENLEYNDLELSLPNYYPDSKYDTDAAENVSLFSESTDFYETQSQLPIENGHCRSLPTYAYEYDSSLSDLEPRYYESNTFNPIFSDNEYQSDSCSELNNFDEITVINNKNTDEIIYNTLNQNTFDNKVTEYEKSIDLSTEDTSSTLSRSSTLKESTNIFDSDSQSIQESIYEPIETLEHDDDIKIDTIHSSDTSNITLISIDTCDYSTPTPKRKNSFFNAKKTKSPTDVKRQNYLREFLETGSKKPIKNFISRAFGDKKSKASPEPFLTLVESQYHSLPDINVSKYLEKCEKIDRKLRKCDKVTRTKSNDENRFVVNVNQHFNIPNGNAQIPVDFEVKISKVPKIQKTTKVGRSTSSITLNKTETKHENKFATLTRQTKEKFLAGFKKHSDSKTNKIKTLPKITEVVEKKSDCKIVAIEKKEEIEAIIQKPKTIRNFTRIDEKPENKYSSSDLDSLEYVKPSLKSLPVHIQESESSEANMESIYDSNKSENASPVQEYQEKLGTMRCFWDKMMNKANGEPKMKTEDKNELEPEQNEHRQLEQNMEDKIISQNGLPEDIHKIEQPKIDNKGIEHKLDNTDEDQSNNNIIHESPPPKLTISKFENMREASLKRPEPCKIVDVTSKLETVRKVFESSEKLDEPGPGLVEIQRKLFEPKLNDKYEDKMGTFIKETCSIFENPFFERVNEENQFESLNPNIVEIIENDRQKALELKENERNLSKTTSQTKQDDNKSEDLNNVDKIPIGSKPKQTALIKAKSFDVGPEFDHVRYKVMKSDRFQKNIFANYEKESQFDGLMQYLKDYSFQELLIDNNIVIIEPIRTKVEYSDAPKKTKKITQFLPKPASNNIKETKQALLRRHFFYHPIRVNREVNDAELPNPDTVKQVRQFFESTGIMKKSQSHKELDNPKKKTIRYQTVIDPDRDHCSESDSGSEKSNNLVEDSFESLPNDTCCEKQFVSEIVLQKIRECGTCVTYYGGKVLEANNNTHSPLTKAIMEEIKGTLRRNDECSCKKRENTDSNKLIDSCQINKNTTNKLKSFDCSQDSKEVYQGIKFKLIKSNSCSSRLELVGTENVSEYRKKFLERQRNIIQEHNLKNQQLQNGNSKIESIKEIKEVLNNESLGRKSKDVLEKIEREESPKIVAEEKKINGKMMQWGEKEEVTQAGLCKTETKTKNYIDYREYEKMRRGSRKFNDMEFESYEVSEK